MDGQAVFAFLVMCLSAHVFETGAVNNSYFISAPSVCRPGRPFKLLVMLSDVITSPVNIVAKMVESRYPRVKNPLMVTSGSGTFTKGPPAELTLQIPHGVVTDPIDFELNVVGTGGVDFNQTKYIRYREKGFSIYVQTDKAIYKPGQEVLMRIFGVLPNLKLYTGNLTVDIVDPDNNKMAHWVDLNSESGVIKREFLLSTEPVEGNWKISVTAQGQKTEQVIEVKPYVLPKFEVKVNLPSYVLKGERKLHGTVDVKYTYGKGAKGKANIKVFFTGYWYNSKPIALVKEEIVESNGQGKFSFYMRDILQMFKDTFNWVSDPDTLFTYGYYRLYVNATFYEDITKKSASGEGSVSFHQNDVKLKFANFNPSYFKPGLPLNVLLQVTQPDGAPLSPDKLASMRSKIQVTTKYKWDGDGEVESFSPAEDGTIIITRNVPSSAAFIRLQVKYTEMFKDPVQTSFYASKSNSPSASYIQLTTTTPSVKAGDDIACDVVSTFALSELKYMVLARGIAVKTGTYTPASSSTKLSFTIPSTPAMAPTARLLVYAMKQGGEVVVDTLNIKVEDPFENNVTLTIDTSNRDSVAPGDTVTIKGKASPDSLMAFRAVDKSVLLMKEDTDLSVQKVLQELQSYDSANTWYPYWEWGLARRDRRSIMPYPTSGRDASSIFENSGVVVFTNYNLPGGWDDRYRIMHAGAEDTLLRANEASPTSGGGSAPKLAEVKRVRSLFPETWIWMERNVSSVTGEVEFQQSVPDTLTTWVASAFAVSPSTGLGVGELKPQVTVFQPFFVSINLPYSVVRGEEVAFQVTVFNYEKEPQLVTITLKGSPDWYVIDEVNSLGLRGKSDNEVYVDEPVDLTAQVSVGSGQGKAVSFPVVLKTLGSVPVEVRAQSSSKADAVKRNLLVEPEGVPQEYSYSLLLDFNSSSSLSHTLELNLPSNTVKGSARATVSVIGDILGSSLNNLDHLVRMPYGCGEQNMVNFVPNIYVIKYLTTVNQLTPAIEKKAKRYMIAGYQREQTYRHNDGSYSAFGGRDNSGSLWLTAFVAKSFAQARSYIPEYVNNELLEQSLVWMARQTNSDGSFRKVGTVHGSYLKGGQEGTISLTAYVLIALAEANSQSRDVVTAKNKAIAYLEGKVQSMPSEMRETYPLAITTYALTLVGSSKKFKALTELRQMASGGADGLMYWEENKDDSSDSASAFRRPYYRPRSADIEITAYAMLAFALERDISVLLPISRWLSQQRNSLGGYSSTQDTVIGLQALSEFAALIYSPDVDFNVRLSSSADPSFAKTFVVNQQNSMVLQQVELLKVAGSLNVNANGRGTGMLQVGVDYNVDKEPGERSFDFVLTVIDETDYEVKVKACSKWLENDGNSGMAVMDIGIPTGFALDSESVEKYLSDSSLKLKRVDTADRKVLLYFDEIPSLNKVCVEVRFERAYDVGKPQPSTAVVYDYYNPGNRATRLYAVDSLQDKGVCRVCPDCVNCNPEDVKTEPSGSSAPGHPATFGAVTLVSLILSMLLN